MKQCSKCQKIKSLDDFYNHQTNADRKSNSCKKCSLAHARARYQKNLESQRERSRIKAAKERAQFPEKVRKRNRENMNYHFSLNPEKFRARSAAWKKANPERVNDWNRSRLSRKKNNQTFFVSEKFLCRLYKSECAHCGSKENITQDHVIPIARGGSHSEGNLQPLCLSCNSSKKDKTMIEWRLPFLRERFGADAVN
jgi:5-methylcytosine-specific restriction endonuclease McrA